MLFQDFEISDLWKIYEKSIEIGHKLNGIQQRATSQFYFNLRIPVLILLYELVNCNEIKHLKLENKSKSYCNIFDNLCDIIDQKSHELLLRFDGGNEHDDACFSKQPDAIDKILKRITKEILKNGVLVFFPSEKTRKDCFLKMIEKNIDSGVCDEASLPVLITSNLKVKTDFSFKHQSTQLLFEAFCNLFCLDKYALVKYLLNSTGNLFESAENCRETIQFVDKLIKFGFFLNESKETDDKLTVALNDLLNSIQSNVFYCMKEQLVYLQGLKADHLLAAKSPNLNVNDADLVDNNIRKFLIEYADLVVAKGVQTIESILTNCQQMHGVDESALRENLRLRNYLTKIIYNLVLWLSELFGHLDFNVCTKIIEILLNFHKKLTKVEKYFNEEEVREF